MKEGVLPEMVKTRGKLIQTVKSKDCQGNGIEPENHSRNE